MYQVLYRKFRSPTFADVVGQDHVTTTLRRALGAGRLSHAYLFTGPRGTGKTSCARILAKAVNCTQNSVEPGNENREAGSPTAVGEPCNACELCLGIDSGAILDVIEIDAASNNGVDNIRDLRDETNFTPSRGKYRVYIIDEVHMLSSGAFNALLKTLEEPPSYVIFILATTEVHKLPATVLSRCQRFDFHRISAEDIAKHLLHVAKQEGLTLEEGAAMLLARVADGAMRDALSLLDRCRTEDDTITTESVAKCIGMADRRYLFELTDAFLARDIATCLTLINKLYNDACEMERLCEELLAHLRNLLILLTVKQPREFLLCTDEDLALYQAQAKRCTPPQLLKFMELLESTGTTLRRSADRRMEMELGLIKLCTYEPSAGGTPAPTLPSNNSALEHRIAQLEHQIKALKSNPLPQHNLSDQPPIPLQEGVSPQRLLDALAFIKSDGSTEEISTVAADNNIEADAPLAQSTQNTTHPPDPAPPPSSTEDRLFAEWPHVLTHLRATSPALAGILDGSSAVSRGDFVLIKCNNPAFDSFIRQATHANNLKEAIYHVSDRKVRLGIFKGDDNIIPKKDPLAQLAERAKNL